MSAAERTTGTPFPTRQVAAVSALLGVAAGVLPSSMGRPMVILALLLCGHWLTAVVVFAITIAHWQELPAAKPEMWRRWRKVCVWTGATCAFFGSYLALLVIPHFIR